MKMSRCVYGKLVNHERMSILIEKQEEKVKFLINSQTVWTFSVHTVYRSN